MHERPLWAPQAHTTISIVVAWFPPPAGLRRTGCDNSGEGKNGGNMDVPLPGIADHISPKH